MEIEFLLIYLCIVLMTASDLIIKFFQYRVWKRIEENGRKVKKDK
jgi:hypothetical protein